MGVDWILILTGLILVLLSIAPLCFGIKHIGVILPLIGGVFLLGYGCFHQKWALIFHHWQGIHQIVVGLFSIGVLFFVAMSLIQSFGFQRYSPGSNTETVIVLGCEIRGDRPSLMLKRRLDRAAELLFKNPEMNCVLTGGQGEDEQYPESKVMKQYLVETGIHPSRLFCEDQSRNTLQNFQFARQVIEQNQLSDEVIVVTDFYHQYRSNFYASSLGMKSEGASCYTNPALFFSYWVREMLGVLKAWILDGSVLHQE